MIIIAQNRQIIKLYAYGLYICLLFLSCFFSPINYTVVSILGTIDDKIESNGFISQKLEQLCLAEFRKLYGSLDDTTSILTHIGAVTKCVLGGTPSREKAEFWNGDIAWINSGKINEFRIIEPSEKITALGLSKSNTMLIPANTTVLAITGATLGQVSILGIDACTNQSVVAILENKDFPTVYIYPLIQTLIGELVSMQTGGAQQHINKGNIEAFEFRLPEQNLLSEYCENVKMLYDKILRICRENIDLVQLKKQYLKKFFS